MLWALLRLSVRDARSQLRYGRFGGPGPARLASGPSAFTAPGPAGPGGPRFCQVVPVRPHTFGWCWDGIACEAGVRKRSPPCFKIALALYPALISRNTRHSHSPRHNRLACPGPEEDERPGEDPGPFG